MLDSGPADLDFVRTRVQANRRLARALRVEELLALWMAWQQGTVTPAQLAPIIQRPANDAVGLLNALVAVGLLAAREDSFSLVGQAQPEKSTEISPAERILSYVRGHGQITRREVAEQCAVSEKQAEYLLRQMVSAGNLQLVGRGRGAYYVAVRQPETPK